MTSFRIELQAEEEAKLNDLSPSVAIQCAGLLNSGNVYQLERMGELWLVL